MPKYFRMIAAFIAAFILMTGCSNQQVVNQTTESPSVQFGPQTSQTTPSPTDPSPDMNETSTSDSTEDSSTEEPAPDQSSQEETSTEETTPEETTPEETTSEETTPEETTRAVIEFTPVEETVYATDFVNLRADYSLDAEILTLLGPGNAITRIGYHEEWSMIRFNGEICYISSDYVTTVAPPTEAPESTEPTTPPTPAIEAPEFEVSYYLNLSNTIFTGRWFSKDISGNSYATVNAGSEFSFRTEGASYAFIYINGNGDGDFYYAYSIDGQSPVRQHISNRVVPLGGSGVHTVRIIIDSLGEHGSRWDESIAIGVRGVTTDAGTISPWHHTASTIAFFGDSITDGIRTLSPSSHSYTNSYVWHCSQALGVIPIVSGFPGSGIVTDGSFNTCINAITNYSATKAAGHFNPSIVVLNHGTNDVSVDSTTFINAYNATLDAIHARFPNAKIACMIPVSQAHADDIRNCVLGKDWCALVETSDWNVTYTDGIHPDASCSYSMGNNLANVLRNLFS